MITRHLSLTGIGIGAALLAALVLGAGAAFAQAPDVTEQPVNLDAQSFLPPELLSGPHHSIDRSVMNDGFLNHYTIRSDVGDMVAVSDAMMRIRVHEIYAIVAIDQVRGTDAYVKSAKEGAKAAVEGAKALVTNPVDTMSGAVSGVSKLFNRAGDALTRTRSDSEDSRVEALIGFSKTKRAYAHEFGVDPYSSNKRLQESLDDISWAGYAGGLTVSAALSMVPGGAGIAVSVTGATRLANDLVRDNAPADLRKLNLDKLLRMGIDQHLADSFVDHAIYSPTQQALLVAALDALGPAVANRQAFVGRAVLATDEDTAFFNQRYAQMIAGYHQAVEPVRELVRVGPVVMAITQSNKLVLTLPLDYMVWTQHTAAVADEVSRQADAAAAGGGRELWLTGALSDLSSAQLSRLGWSVVAQTEDTLLGR